ncbi:hypothetical protein HELRODRAFT_181942 [Helobdella robusta]|uniref:Uncharacterized protein n=1 Tax=Helobdella robusta TaxID=6412 RepID=T1FHH5_HELRO|nr:hypothetical protein HELRODRAFT_181942 [Helobdella robusta]ESN92012.1 hypothetical protein HELRODRAFT_181942 [Helobdella robusta]
MKNQCQAIIDKSSDLEGGLTLNNFLENKGHRDFLSPTYFMRYRERDVPRLLYHYRSTPDGKLCRHGGKVKGQECSGSRKKVDPSGARAASPLGAAPDPKPGLPTRSSAASVSGDPLGLDYSGVFDKLTAVLKCVPVYDHIPKPCREKFAHDLNALLTAVCNDPGDPAHWVRLHCFFPYVLQKTSRGGRRVNQGNLVNKRLNEYSTIGLETLVLCFDGFNNAKSQKHNLRMFFRPLANRRHTELLNPIH